MANYCDYEIHIKGNKKAVLYLCTMLPVVDYQKITREQGNDEEYTVWIIGNCKGSLDCYCKEKRNVSINLDSLSETEIRNNVEIGLDYVYLTMRQKSEVLGVEILAHSWSDESGFDQFEHYLNGKLISSELNEYNPNPAWDKREIESYNEFCKKYGIDPQKVPEAAWSEDDEDIYYCDIELPRHVSNFKFVF